MNKKQNRIRSSKIHVWMRPELIKQINEKTERLGLSRDGSFEQGMCMWVSEEMKNGKK